MVCEGQSLYDSHALVAEDMKAEIRSQIAQGRSDQEIKTFLIERYGDHVLMKTPVNARTGLLWIFPLLVLLIGLWFVRKLLRRKFTRP